MFVESQLNLPEPNEALPVAVGRHKKISLQVFARQINIEPVGERHDRAASSCGKETLR